VSLVISVCALKGGVGKSTICLNLASTLHRAGHRTLLVDLDSQATLRAWAARSAESGYDGPPVVGLDGRTLRRDLEKVSEGFEIVVLDSPPRLGTEARAAMLVADLVLMPVTPGAADVWALQETLTVLEEAKGLRPELQGVIVRNRVDRTALTSSSKSALEQMSVPVLEAALGNRVAFGEATLAGQGVVDYAPDSPAASEVKALVTDLVTRMGGTVNGQKGRTRSRVQASRKAAPRTPN
jgi:chromosome partitioning protein